MSLLSDFGAATDADDDDDGVAAGELSTLSWPALLLLLNNNTSVQSYSTKSCIAAPQKCPPNGGQRHSFITDGFLGRDKSAPKFDS